MKIEVLFVAIFTIMSSFFICCFFVLIVYGV